jgi:hypothetical protein
MKTPSSHIWAAPRGAGELHRQRPREMPVFTQKFPFDRRAAGEALNLLPGTPDLLTERYYRELDRAHPLGVGWNKVESIRGWMRAAGLIRQVSPVADRGAGQWELTPLGQFINAADPYLSKTSTMWIIHVQLATNPEATVYHGLFAYCTAPSFTRDSAAKTIREHTKELAIGSINSELEGILRSFVHGSGSKLDTLGVLMQDGDSFVRGLPEDLSIGVVGYALLRLRERDHIGVPSTSFAVLAERPGGLCTIFGLEARPLRDALRSLNDRFSAAGFRFSETAGLDSLTFGTLEAFAVLPRIISGELRDAVIG